MPDRLFKAGRQFLVRVPRGDDLWNHLAAFSAEHKIRCAAVSVIGATSKVTIGYYDQKKHKYHSKTFRGEMEIVSCSGNVSLKEGKPYLHLHAVMGDTALRCFGGHLFPGSSVFAAEVHIQELLGKPNVRLPDVSTGLALWSCP